MFLRGCGLDINNYNNLLKRSNFDAFSHFQALHVHDSMLS